MTRSSLSGTMIAIAIALSRVAIGDAHANASAGVRCPAFTNALPQAAQQTDPEAVERFQQIIAQVRSGPHDLLFLGDSLTRKWDEAIWHQAFPGALNAGVNGDRTEHLLWRLEHGTLDGQHPRAVVLLIGTNDIGRNRPPAIVAETIREILWLLRSHLPDTKILLLGVLPRGESPVSGRRYQVSEVNRLIQTCADRQHVFYADLRSALLDRTGRLSPAISPDGVHLSRDGYARLTAAVQSALYGILPPPAAAGGPAQTR